VHIDRDATLKRAAKLLRQGKLDAAINEYVRLTAAVPGDTSAVNALGDLYVRAGQIDRAVAQFALAGEQLAREGAAGRAAAVYKKILRISPGNTDATVALERLGAKGKRRRRKDGPVLALDDPESRMTAARVAQDASDVGRACVLLIEAADLFELQGRHADALAAVAEASSIDPANTEYRLRLLHMLIAQDELMQARSIARVASELLMVAEAFEAAGRPQEAAETIAEAARADPGHRPRRADAAPRPEEDRAATTGDVPAADAPDAGFGGVDAAADAAVTAGDWDRAVTVLEDFVTRVPHHVSALLKLIEVCVDGGLTEKMSATQERLADAYLHAGRGAEARLIAEDLVMRAPWEQGRVQRLLRALVLCHDPDPEQTVAHLLCSDGSYFREGL
jgi:tetratricopeptide (TPR) repeat protein